MMANPYQHDNARETALKESNPLKPERVNPWGLDVQIWDAYMPRVQRQAAADEWLAREMKVYDKLKAVDDAASACRLEWLPAIEVINTSAGRVVKYEGFQEPVNYILDIAARDLGFPPGLPVVGLDDHMARPNRTIQSRHAYNTEFDHTYGFWMKRATEHLAIVEVKLISGGTRRIPVNRHHLDSLLFHLIKVWKS